MSSQFQILTSLDSLSEARRKGEGHLLIQGDSGGETFLTCPVRLAKCSAETVFLLMLDLESLSQVGTLSDVDPGPDIPTSGYDAWVICGHFDIGDSYQGGKIVDRIWLNDKIEDAGLGDDVRGVIGGEKERLSAKLDNNFT